MMEPTDVWNKRLIVTWCVLLVLGYFVATIFTAGALHEDKEAAVLRHDARLDEKKVEAGQTATVKERFDLGREPMNIRVTSGFYVDRIFDVELRRTHWKVDFYIWFRWSGPNVHPGDNFQIINGEIIKKELVADTDIGDEHYELYRITAEITKFFNISRYPRDDHLMTILIEDTKRQFFDLNFVPDISGSAISSRAKIPGYKIYATSVVEKGHSYKTRRGNPRLSITN